MLPQTRLLRQRTKSRHKPVNTLVKTSHLLAPFPETMIDSAVFDRFHGYLPGWEIPKMRPAFFTNQ